MAFSEESLRQLSGLAGAVLGQEDLRSTLDEGTRLSVAALSGCDGASMTTFEAGRPSVVAADSQWSRSLDELQHEEREGPCLDAARTGNVFRVRDLAQESRWPFCTRRAAEAGARSTVSLPMTSEGKIMGALDAYSSDCLLQASAVPGCPRGPLRGDRRRTTTSR